MSKTGRFTAVLLVIVLLAAGVTAWLTNGFKEWDPFGWFRTEQGGAVGTPDDEETESCGMVIEGEGTETLPIRQYRIARGSYAVYAVPASAESAYTLVATVGPENSGTNTAVEWTIAFADPSHEWAQGKRLSDYVTLTVSGTGLESKQAVVACLQPFGAQIVITVTSVTSPEVQTTRTVDYVRKITDFTLSFGDVACDFASGHTGVTVELAETGIPKGGATDLNVIYKDTAYTRVAEYEVDYDLKPFTGDGIVNNFVMWRDPSNGVLFYYRFCAQHNSSLSDFESYDLVKNGLYFGIKYWVDTFGFGGAFTPSGMSVDPFFGETLQKACHAVIAGTLNSEDLASPNLRSIFSLKVTLTGKHVNMSKSTDFIMSDYTNLPKVTDVEINGGNAGDGNIEF
ncbi:MAG: hypothetical protein HFE28_03220 [Clostridia bacterium]|jgi:hypothetical protein|nr:hypothetical protein [Clostridia bacterium]